MMKGKIYTAPKIELHEVKQKCSLMAMSQTGGNAGIKDWEEEYEDGADD